MKIYLSGSIANGRTWEEEQSNKDWREKFKKAELALIRKGYEVWSPVKEVPNPLNRKAAIYGDILGIFQCDGVALIDDILSKGVRAEIAVAESIEIPVKKLSEWLECS